MTTPIEALLVAFEIHAPERIRDILQAGFDVTQPVNGQLPINVSGGLVSKGHPVGATGLSMIYELTGQLRGSCEARQVKDADVAVAENGGGVIGFDEAACAITILQR